jgi:hypothetical protein
LLSNIYAGGGNSHLHENVEQQIESNSEVPMIVVDDQDCPQMIEICEELQRLSGLMHDAGYVPNTKFVLHDVEEEEKVSFVSP